MPRLDGIDGSHHQPDAGPVDLTLTAAIPTYWWAWKATQSIGYVDPTFAPMWVTARALFSHRGAYHWLSSTTNPNAQAAHFKATVGVLGVGEFAMLDAEERGITEAQCLAWCESVEDATRRPTVVYSGLYVSGGSIWKSKALRVSQYGPRPFIVAAYISAANLAARMISTGSTGFPYQAWQYSSNGPVAGITGRCDMDQIDDRAAFDLASAIPPPPAQLEDDDVKIVANKTTRTMPYGDAPPASAIFAVGEFKRNIGAEEYRELYGNAAPILLSNEALDAIPDYVAVIPLDLKAPVTLSLSLSGGASGTIG